MSQPVGVRFARLGSSAGALRSSGLGCPEGCITGTRLGPERIAPSVLPRNPHFRDWASTFAESFLASCLSPSGCASLASVRPLERSAPPVSAARRGASPVPGWGRSGSLPRYSLEAPISGIALRRSLSLFWLRASARRGSLRSPRFVRWSAPLLESRLIGGASSILWVRGLRGEAGRRARRLLVSLGGCWGIFGEGFQAPGVPRRVALAEFEGVRDRAGPKDPWGRG